MITDPDYQRTALRTITTQGVTDTGLKLMFGPPRCGYWPPFGLYRTKGDLLVLSGVRADRGRFRAWLEQHAPQWAEVYAAFEVAEAIQGPQGDGPPWVVRPPQP